MFEWSQGKFHWELLGLRLQPLVLMENPAAARLLDDLVREVTAQATYDLHKFSFQGMYLSRLTASREGSRDAGSNSHKFARIRIRPEFARIRGPL